MRFKVVFSALCFAALSIAVPHAAPPNGTQTPSLLDREVEDSNASPSQIIITTTRSDAIVQFPAKTAGAAPKPKFLGVYNTHLDRRGHPNLPPFPQPDLKLANITSPIPMKDHKLFRSIEAKFLNRTISDSEAARLNQPHDDAIASALASGPPPVPPRPTPAAAAASSARRAPPPIPPRMRERQATSASNLFNPISTAPPPGVFPVRNDHPVPKIGIRDNGPIETNKFYANFFLGARNQGTWTQPYMLWWQQADGNLSSWGLSVSHIEASQRAFGPLNDVGANNYYINPIRIQYFTFGAAEFLHNTSDIGVSDSKHMSANVHFYANPHNKNDQRITFPLTQGMGFVTGLYTNLSPVFQSAVLFRSVDKVTSYTRAGITKYRIILEDGRKWLLYMARTDPYFSQPVASDTFLSLVNNSTLKCTSSFTGIAQLARIPSVVDDESVWDNSAGGYAAGVQLGGAVNGNVGTYSFNFQRAGIPAAPVLQYAMPHHLESMTSGGVTGYKLMTTTKGEATLIQADSWTLTEHNLPVGLGFAPVNEMGVTASFSQETVATIAAAAQADVNQNFEDQINLNSMYFAGKAISKFATIAWVAGEVVKDRNLANNCLNKLKSAFSRFLTNRQVHPLYYETSWKGLVSSAGYTTGDLNQDFGNPAYNDHHFHYGYHVHAAAVIAYLDRLLGNGDGWLSQNRDVINTMIRDFANPSEQDPYFPVSRAFDWFHGHSWAKGLFESADGKDQESSSEDVFAYYGMKLWGDVTGDTSMSQRASLMLAIQKRSFANYYLLLDSNKNHPLSFIKNKVPGILFDNKVDHVTYFGAEREKVQGIQMIPLAPISTYIRSPQYCIEEWNTWFKDNYVGLKVNDGWKGILMANLAIFNPRDAWWFFTRGFRNEWLDGGASLSWYLTWVAGLGGAPS